jgi:hypothetical protein
MKVFKVVKFDQVEYLTMQGWELAQIIATSHGMPVPCSTPFMAPVANNYSPGVQYASRDEVVQVNEPLFMLSKDNEELSREAVLAGKLDLAATEGKKLLEKLTIAEANVAKEQGEHFAYQKRYDELHKTHYELVAKNRKLEVDLGKVRTAIGTKAFEEVIK